MEDSLELLHIDDLPRVCVANHNGKLVICRIKAIPLESVTDSYSNLDWKTSSSHYKKFYNTLIKCKDILYRVTTSKPFKKAYHDNVNYELEVI